jgi:hypothetical protein
MIKHRRVVQDRLGEPGALAVALGQGFDGLVPHALVSRQRSMGRSDLQASRVACH